MSALPENWEWDYDGERQRWFYRYKPTGITQFHFPQPGDEFPQTIDDSAPIDLEPEERLVSQQQVKRRSTVGEKTSTSKAKNTLASATIAEDDDGSSAPWFQPDVFMYMGPGAYDDISPLQEDEDGLPKKEASENTQRTNPASTSAPAPAPPPVSEASPQQSTISPLVSAQTTPLVVQSLPVIESPPVIESAPVNHLQPAVQSHHVVESHPLVHQPVVETQPIAQNPPHRTSQEIDSAQIVEVHGESAPVVDSIPLLDSRQVAYTPVGFVAELPSELTGQCHEDINPTPVELPGNDIMMDTGPPLIYANAFPLAPSELHSDAIPPSRRQRQGDTEQKALSSGSPIFDFHRHQNPPDPYRPPARLNSMPQSVVASAQLDSKRDPYQGQFRPWNPTMHAVTEEAHRQAPVAENKRHSLAGPPPSNWRRPEIPAPLSAPMVSPKKPADLTEESTSALISGHGARHESISAPVQSGNASGLTHVPSVLQPARGRPVLSKSPPKSQSPPRQSPPSHSTDTNQRYTAYKPTSWDLQRDIEETVEMLSKTGYGQAASDPDRPALPRTNTAPGESAVGSYYGMRPQIPPSIPSAPSALQIVKSQPALSYHYNISEASTTRSSDFSAPLPPSSPDLPQPLKLTRKSPPPAPQNSLPTVSSTLRPPAPPVHIVSRETTPAPSNHPTTSVPTMTTPEIQATRSRDPVSPPQTPPPLPTVAKDTPAGPPLVSFSARTSTWGEGRTASVPPRENSLSQDQGQETSRANKRQSLPVSVGPESWSSQYSRPGVERSSPPQLGYNSEESRQPQPPPLQRLGYNSSQQAPTEVSVRNDLPRLPKTPHTPELRSSSLQTPAPSFPAYQGAATQARTTSPQSTPGGANTMVSRAPSSLSPPTISSDVPYVLPAGHHPLSSHPVNLSEIPLSKTPLPTKPSHQTSQDDPTKPSSLRNNRYSMLITPGTILSSSQPPPRPTPSPPESEQSAVVTSRRRSMIGPPPTTQPQPVVHTSSQPVFNTDERVPPGLVPQRTASLRRSPPQPNRSSPAVPDGPPPPQQKSTAYTPPTSPPSTVAGQSGQNANFPLPLGPQFRVAPPQQQPFTQPTPQPIASPPQQESKGSFFGIGKLFRSDSLRKGGSSSAATKLQKTAAKNAGGQFPLPVGQQQPQSGRTVQMNAHIQHPPTQPAHHMRQSSQPLLQHYQPQNYPPFPQQQQQRQGFSGVNPGGNSGAPAQAGQGETFFASAGGGGSPGFGGGGHRPFSIMMTPSAGATRPPPPVTNNSHDGAGWGVQYR